MSIRSLLTVALALLPIGCTSASFEVIRSVDPSPYSKASAFAIQPIRYVDLKVDDKPEADFIASRKSGEEADKWGVIKANIQDRFSKKLSAELAIAGVAGAAGATVGVAEAAAGAGSAFSIEPSIETIETGYYRIPAWNAVARIYMTLRIVGPGGQVVDEIRLMDRKGFDAIAASTANIRLTNVADALAAAVAEHIVERANKER
ncbi:MAG TPA: hypothetical protein VFD82_17090 [Planctomycetota bacterium]|nr:hypothetical protein [Planctomycetota bacterium]